MGKKIRNFFGLLFLGIIVSNGCFSSITHACQFQTPYNVVESIEKLVIGLPKIPADKGQFEVINVPINLIPVAADRAIMLSHSLLDFETEIGRDSH